MEWATARCPSDTEVFAQVAIWLSTTPTRTVHALEAAVPQHGWPSFTGMMSRNDHHAAAMRRDDRRRAP
jgi:hypothetical protein